MKKPISKDITDGFWHDCINEKGLIIDPLPTNSYNFNYTGRHKNNKLRNRGNYNFSMSKKKNNNFSTNKTNTKTIDHSFFTKIYKKHPMLKENDNEKKYIELRKKNAMMRCLGLYAYGVEVKKTKMLNDENHKKERMKEEISPCTFRPKICKYSKNKLMKYIQPDIYKKNKSKKNNNNVLSNGDYKINTTNVNEQCNGVTHKNIKNKKFKKNNSTIDNNNEEDSNETDECTFKPKIIKKNIQKIFDKSKSVANEKDNAEFILRYTKAREEYMIKKLKKLSTKDDSYDTTLLTLAQRLNNNQYRNASVDNYDVKYKKNNKKANLSMNDYKDLSNENKRTINIEKNVIDNLRSDLLELNLNEE
jgi:hypothetical protein